MQVLLIRHTHAAQARGLAERLRWYDCAPSRIWSTAAGIETAELVAAAFTAPPPVEAVTWLADGVAAARVLAAAQLAMIAVCADEPVLSTLAAQLIAAPFAPLPRGHAARIIDGRLRWRFGWDADAPEA